MQDIVSAVPFYSIVAVCAGYLIVSSFSAYRVGVLGSLDTVGTISRFGGCKRGEIEIDESYFGAKRVRGKRGRGASGKQPVFGMLKRDGKVYTQIVKNCFASELIPILSQYSELDSSTIYSDCWKAYDGLVDYAALAHYRVKHSKNEFANCKRH